MTVKIAINGLGRIGRAIVRAYFEENFENQGIELVSVNGPAKTEDHAHLIKYDSIHGTFKGDISTSGDDLIINGKTIKVFHERDPANINWENIDIVLECSGKFNKRDEAAKHIKGSVKKVIVSAPCDNADKTVVFGVNSNILTSEDKVISIGSCTTNALAPIAKVLNDKIGIESGFMTTIHAYTNDQNIMDGSHKDIRRSRAAALSMVPTSTGAAKAIGLVLPELAGKLSGSAIRVPTPNVSLVDLVFNAKKQTNIEEVNNAILHASNNELKSVLGVAPAKLVSIDFNHSSYSSTFDPFETSVTNGNLVRVISWYDNEWGFSVRMLDVTKLFGSL